MQNMTYYSTGRLFSIAKEAYKRSEENAINNISDDALVAIIFATSTLEAFMSQTVSTMKSWAHLHSKFELFANLIGELDSKEAGASLKIKYNMAHWIICDKPFDRSSEPYQSFDLLVNLRNMLIHLKPDKMASKKIDKLLRQLKAKKLISDYDPMQRMTWVFFVSTPIVAKWACDTTAKMIQEFWKHTPDEKVKQFFRTHANASHYRPLDGKE
jgi:hypothetical protein